MVGTRHCYVCDSDNVEKKAFAQHMQDHSHDLEKVKFSGITWSKDNKGIFYGCYPHHDLSAATGTDTGELKDQKVCPTI